MAGLSSCGVAGAAGKGPNPEGTSALFCNGWFNTGAFRSAFTPKRVGASSERPRYVWGAQLLISNAGCPRAVVGWAAVGQHTVCGTVEHTPRSQGASMATHKKPHGHWRVELQAHSGSNQHCYENCEVGLAVREYALRPL